MPVKKRKKKKTLLDSIIPDSTRPQSCGPLFHMGEHGRRLFVTLFGILLAYVIIWFATLIRNNLQEYYYIGQADRPERTITISAEDTVTASPDVVKTTIGMNSHGDTVSQAQEMNTKVMNHLISELKELGIEDENIQTKNYNVYPRYRYTEKDGQVEDGFDVSQHVLVKSYDVDLANKVIALAGNVGANSVSGLQFTMDDPEVYKKRARSNAINKARVKADELAKELGVSVVRVVAYSEFSDGGGVYPFFRTATLESSVGGSLPEPNIESGSLDVTAEVNITYEIR